MYIAGGDNTVTDALLCLPVNTFLDEIEAVMPHVAWSGVASVLSIASDTSILEAIKSGYSNDDFCARLSKLDVLGAKFVIRLWYVGSRLVILCVGDIRENLYQLAHDTLGHFGADKSYASLCDAYYWLNMRQDLE